MIGIEIGMGWLDERIMINIITKYFQKKLIINIFRKD